MLTYSDRSPALASVRLTPEPPDDEIAALCESFTVRDAPGRDAVRQALEPRDHGTLFTFAQRMAVLAMRESSPRRLHHGPTALVMSDVAHLDSWDLRQRRASFDMLRLTLASRAATSFEVLQPLRYRTWRDTWRAPRTRTICQSRRAATSC